LSYQKIKEFETEGCMRVALINADQDVWAPGMRTISSILRQAGHETRLLFPTTDFRYLSDLILTQRRERVADCDLIGISSLSRGSEKAKRVLQHLRPLRKPTVRGGVHATLAPEQCAAHADFVCIGEGDGMLLDMVGRIEQGHDGRPIQTLKVINEYSRERLSILI
jgi:anaerobic magnesium-protoporphyrin IX monomethyl ester cyclase